MKTDTQQPDPIRILLLEDNLIDAELITAHIEQDGLGAMHSIVSQEGDFRRQLVDFAPQLILSDFSLPAFDGLSALRIARADAPQVPFIFVSGTIGEERAIEALKSGASDYVLKDNLRRLVPAIRGAMRQYEVAKERDHAEMRLRLSESRLQNIVDSSADWIWETDAKGRFTFSSPSVGTILGYARDELLGTATSGYVAADNQDLLAAAFEGAGSGTKASAPQTLRWQHRNGEMRWLERKMVALRDNDATLRGFRGTDRDVTTRVIQQARIDRLNRALRFLSGTNSAIVRIRDRRELLREACRLAVELGEYTMATVYLRATDAADEHIVCRALSSRQSQAKRPHREPLDGDGPVGQAMATGRPIIVHDLEDSAVVVPDRAALLGMGIRSCISLPLVVDGTPVGAALLHADEANVFGEEELALLQQVTGNITFSLQYLHSRESAQYLEYFDPLTQLANRSLYVQRLDAAIKGAKNEVGLLLFVFDISGLTMINDGLGHHTGDVLLQLVAERMRSAFLDSSHLCHLGGGRFGVYSVCLRGDDAASTQLRKRIDLLFDDPFSIDNQQLRLSIKVGITTYPEDGLGAEALLHCAQTALDHAKAAGEPYLRHRPDMNASASRRLNLTNHLRECALQKEFVLHYQPKVAIRDRSIDGMEALLRWPGGSVGPDVFVPILESAGLIDSVGQWVLDRALSESASWSGSAEGDPVCVAVNVSPLQLRRREFAQEVFEILDRRGASPSRLQLEVTESTLMADPTRVEATLMSLREAGVTIAIDDFGTGHSSLQVLSRLPLDVLKIDRSFVRDLPSDRRCRLVVQTTIALAQSFGLKTVAEGVETLEQVTILGDMGCDTMQGYFLLRPTPACELGDWLAEIVGKASVLP
jgi:PAS domain S-box-containing protein/diguanylate cyclase (GGDEF)-like protein